MSQYKYDGYGDYVAGVRFIESLATWLQQFNIKDERRAAYDYVKNNLIYYSSAEIQRLVHRFYNGFIQKDLVSYVSERLGIPKYSIWSTKESRAEYRWELRKTLIMGLSDGAKIDNLRRANVGIITNEQTVAATQIDATKWGSLIKDLRDDLDRKKPGLGAKGKFSRIYLVDDFTASGTSLLRFDENGRPKGKLQKLHQSLQCVKSELAEEFGDFLEEGWTLKVHHYIGTMQAQSAIEDRYKKGKAFFELFDNVSFSYSLVLPDSIKLDQASDHPFVAICENYYDSVIEDKHSEESGDPDMTFGYGKCSLPVVLEHNTPNNSLPLLWAETTGSGIQHAMRPLFRRRQRHSEFIE